MADLGPNAIVEQFTRMLSPESEGAFSDEFQSFIDKDQKTRLVVDIDKMRVDDPEFVHDLLTKPATFLPALDRALQDLVVLNNPELRKDLRKLSEYHVGLEGSFGHRKVNPRQLKTSLVGNIVAVDGIVTRCSNVRPKLVRSVQYCPATGKFHEQHYKDNVSIANFVTLSSIMPAGSAYKTKDENDNPLEMEYGMSWFADSQRITIQEMPETSPAGQLPRSVEVLLEKDLVDSCKPGDRVRVIGVYRAIGGISSASTSGVFRTLVVGNNVKQLSKNSLATLKITPTDISNIRKLAAQPAAFDILSRSIAPSIYGFSEVKKAILLLLLGGAEKNLASGTHLRGDINLLMVGDPSTAKSQLLRFVLKTAPLALSTTGRGSSGVGLTAAVTSDPDTGERHLEAGAMVLADRGVVCIDEFDKMSDEDRVAIHEVMEQQTVTISKAGIHASLNARCSVIAAANPLYGSYDRQKKPHENIALPDSLLSRFDLLFIILDQVTPDNDRSVADHVLRVHRYRPNDGSGLAVGMIPDVNRAEQDTANNEGREDGTSLVYERLANTVYGMNGASTRSGGRGRSAKALTVEFLKKYVQYAKSRVKPELSVDAAKYIAQLYSELRTQQLNLSLPITARSLETIIRLSTAHAKSRLSNMVEVLDAKIACEILKASLGIQTELEEEAVNNKKRKRKERQAAKKGGDDGDHPGGPDDNTGARHDDDNNSSGDDDEDKESQVKDQGVGKEKEKSNAELKEKGDVRRRSIRAKKSAKASLEEDDSAEEDEDLDAEIAEDVLDDILMEDEEPEKTAPASAAQKAHTAGGITSIQAATHLLRTELNTRMGRTSDVASKQELYSKVVAVEGEDNTSRISESLFEEALSKLVEESLILIHEDSIFRV